MSTQRRATPSAIDVRHVGAVLVLVACITGTVITRQDTTHVLITWLIGFFYLAFCMEPMRRVLRDARVTWVMATTFVLTTVLCISVLFCLPATAETGRGAFSVLSRLAGTDHLSDAGRGAFENAAFASFFLLAAGTLSLWVQVLRMARRSEWASIDHTVGNGSFHTGTRRTGSAHDTSVTRPAQRNRR